MRRPRRAGPLHQNPIHDETVVASVAIKPEVAPALGEACAAPKAVSTIGMKPAVYAAMEHRGSAADPKAAASTAMRGSSAIMKSAAAPAGLLSSRSRVVHAGEGHGKRSD